MIKLQERTARSIRRPPPALRRSHAPAPSLALGPSPAERHETGRRLRVKCPRRSHAMWQPADSRPDPVSLVKESNKGRIAKLIPIRYGRMAQSPFTFYRGAALNMAADLASTPTTGLHVHVCGD